MRVNVTSERLLKENERKRQTAKKNERKRQTAKKINRPTEHTDRQKERHTDRIAKSKSWDSF